MKNGNTNDGNKKRRIIVRRRKTNTTESSGVGQSIRKNGENGSGIAGSETGVERSKNFKPTIVRENGKVESSSGSDESEIVRVGSSGRKRSTGNGSGSYSTTSTRTSGARGSETGSTESERAEIPEIPIRKRRRRISKSNVVEEAAIAGMLSVACTAIYSTTALFFGDHWNVTDAESSMLASSLDNALKTLPQNTYEELRKYFDQFIPWVALAITAGAITIPRIEYSRELARQRVTAGNARNDNNVNARQSDVGNGKANPFPDTV